MTPRSRAYLASALAYVVALVAAWGTTHLAPMAHPFWDAAIADVVATFVIFGFSVGFNNSSFYDPYWSAAPPALFGYWLTGGSLGPASGLALALVLLWAARLTFNFYRGWPDLSHEDWRYGVLQEQHGKLYWLVSFFGIHFFPTVLTFAGSAALYVLATGAPSLGPLHALGAAVTLLGIAYEGVADEQLRAFRNSSPPKGSWLETGLWKHSRHPNYFGEVTFWWGLAIMGLATDSTAYWVLFGPLAITLLFFFISIPMIDERMKKRRPGYEAHMRNVSRLVPWRRG